jgi:hypothetical protein
VRAFTGGVPGGWSDVVEVPTDIVAPFPVARPIGAPPVLGAVVYRGPELTTVLDECGPIGVIRRASASAPSTGTADRSPTGADPGMT